MEKLDLIVNLLNDNRADVKDVKEDISEMKVDVALNRQDLEVHMAQTRAVKELVLEIREESNSRIDVIEKKLTVTHLLKLIVTVASGIAAVSGAAYGVIKLITYYS